MDKSYTQDTLLQGWDKGWAGGLVALGAMIYCRDGGAFLLLQG